MTERGEGSGIGLWLWMTALRHNGHARYGEALAAARQACEHEDVIAYGWALVELIEAGVRSDRRNEAAAALEPLAERTQASGTEWALGIQARCRALLSDDESLYDESVERLTHSRAALELARSRLLYGEWLRREHRRIDAREQLRTAHEMFTQIGAEAFAERARRELAATGETVRKRTVDTLDELTTQEAQVARLAAQGHTNPEIGAQLFISPRTVEYHLRKVFTKLDISSRKAAPTSTPHHRTRRRPCIAHSAGRTGDTLVGGSRFLLMTASHTSDLRASCEQLRALHRRGAPLVLPNAWDVGTARAVVAAGFPVIATTSWAVAAALGYEDEERAPAEEMFAAAARIARSVDVPVTVDAEAGYGLEPAELVAALRNLGAAGCNLEDTDHAAGSLRIPTSMRVAQGSPRGRIEGWLSTRHQRSGGCLPRPVHRG